MPSGLLANPLKEIEAVKDLTVNGNMLSKTDITAMVEKMQFEIFMQSDSMKSSIAEIEVKLREERNKAGIPRYEERIKSLQKKYDNEKMTNTERQKLLSKISSAKSSLSWSKEEFKRNVNDFFVKKSQLVKKQKQRKKELQQFNLSEHEKQKIVHKNLLFTVLSSFGAVISSILIFLTSFELILPYFSLALFGILTSVFSMKLYNRLLLFKNPHKYFKLSSADETIASSEKFSKLINEWLTKVAIKQVEEAIVNVGKLAGTWDNDFSKLKNLKEQAEKDNNRAALEKIELYQSKLDEYKARIQLWVESLRAARDELNSLKKYDLQLMEMQARIENLGQETDDFVANSAQVLTRIRNTIDLALTMEVNSFLKQGDKFEIENLDKLVEIQSKVLKGLPVVK